MTAAMAQGRTTMIRVTRTELPPGPTESPLDEVLSVETGTGDALVITPLVAGPISHERPLMSSNLWVGTGSDSEWTPRKTFASPRIARAEVGQAMKALKGEDATNFWSGHIGSDRFHFLLVADGHGGRDAAQICAQTVLENIRSTAGSDPCAASIKHACYQAFRQANADVRSRPGCTAGSTLSVVCVNVPRAEITIANVGDSAVYLFPYQGAVAGASGGARSSRLPRFHGSSSAHAGRFFHAGASGSSSSSGSSVQTTPTAVSRKSVVSSFDPSSPSDSLHEEDAMPVPLSEDHRLDRNEAERQRIVAAGGSIAPAMGPAGVKEGPLRSWPGGLAVARGIGDVDCDPYVSPEPAVRTLPVPSHGAALIAASDGVWDSLPVNVVADLIYKTVERHPAVLNVGLLAEQIVAKAARHRGDLFDDTSCLLLHLTTEGSMHCMAMQQRGPHSVHGSGPFLRIGHHSHQNDTRETMVDAPMRRNLSFTSMRLSRRLFSGLFFRSPSRHISPEPDDSSRVVNDEPTGLSKRFSARFSLSSQHPRVVPAAAAAAAGNSGGSEVLGIES